MANKKYGEEMSKIVRFIPKGQRTLEDIYSGEENDENQRHSSISEENTTKQIFGQERFYLRPTDEGYDEITEIKPKKHKSQKKIQKPTIKKSQPKNEENSAKKSTKKRPKGPMESKVVQRERRRVILNSLKPTKAHMRVAFISISMSVLLVMFVSFFYVSSKVASVQYENLELKKQYETKRYEKKELETKLESSNRSDIIETVAREQLKMSYPRPDQIVYIKSN